MKKLLLRPYIISLILSVFIINAIIPTLATYNSAITSQEISSAQKDKILICTNAGMKWVDIKSESNPNKSPQKEKNCAICYISNNIYDDFTNYKKYKFTFTEYFVPNIQNFLNNHIALSSYQYHLFARDPPPLRGA